MEGTLKEYIRELKAKGKNNFTDLEPEEVREFDRRIKKTQAESPVTEEQMTWRYCVWQGDTLVALKNILGQVVKIFSAGELNDTT